MQDDGELFTEDGKAKAEQASGDWWRGPNGLYRVGFSGRGLLGSGADALRAAADIAGRWQAERVEPRSPRPRCSRRPQGVHAWWCCCACWSLRAGPVTTTIMT
jgi:hypothetical protein